MCGLLIIANGLIYLFSDVNESMDLQTIIIGLGQSQLRKINCGRIMNEQ
jgi:hypothetical protein